MTEEQITFVKNSWKMFRKVDAGLIGDVFIQNYFGKPKAAANVSCVYVATVQENDRNVKCNNFKT